MYCDGNNATTSVRHALQLGVECEDEDDGIFFFYQDNYFECAGLSAQFDFLDVKGENFTAFTCIQSAQFPVGSKLDDNITIPELSIGTDYIWDIAADDTCYGISKATSAPSTVMPVAITLAPMSSPTTLAPSTLSPVTKPPTKVPTTSPVTSTPTGRPVTEMPVSLAPVEQAPPVAAALNAERSSSLQIFNFLGWASGLNTVAWGIGLGLAMLF